MKGEIERLRVAVESGTSFGLEDGAMLLRALGAYIEDRPFETRLARTSYFVLPKMAIDAMPQHWQKRLEALLLEMEEAGIKETPEYFCFVQDNSLQKGQVRNMAIERGEYDPAKAYYVFVDPRYIDPWANYRRGDIRELCPDFKGGDE